MAVTAYTGPPGAGKSYALVSQVILPGVKEGRRVVTNVAGLNPQRVVDFAALKWPDCSPGEVVTFDRNDVVPGQFFPTENKPDAATFIKAGDLLVFDEWRLSFSNRGKLEDEDLEPFLRWHRHLVSADGVATDVVIGTQLITDIHRDFRGLVERSYKFRKLSAVGLNKAYKFDVFEGSDQRKGTAFRVGNGKFRPEIFALYKSFDVESGDATEKKTDGRATLFSKGFVGIALLALFGILLGAYGVMKFFGLGQDDRSDQAPVYVAGSQGVPPAAMVPQSREAPASSRWRIVGMVTGVGNPQVIVSDDKGTVRLEPGREFEFEGDRPVSGYVDGERVVAVERVVTSSQGLEL